MAAPIYIEGTFYAYKLKIHLFINTSKLDPVTEAGL